MLTGATESTLSGNNTYTGATTVNGVLTISSGTALGDTAAGTAVTPSGAKTLIGGRIEGTLAGTGATTIPNGTTDLNGSITGGLATIVTGGVLNLTGDSLVSELGFVGDELTASADATLTGLAVGVRGTGQSGIISVVKVQGGTQILSGPNTYSGTTTISAGTLQVGNGGTTGTLGNGDVINNAALAIDRSNALTLANAISGTGAVTVTGGGTVTLTGANTFTGGLTVEEGTVALSGGSALADTNAVTVELDAILPLINSERMGAVTNRRTLDLSGGNDVAGAILTVNGDYAAESDLVLDVVLGGDGSALAARSQHDVAFRRGECDPRHRRGRSVGHVGDGQAAPELVTGTGVPAIRRVSARRRESPAGPEPRRPAVPPRPRQCHGFR